MLGRPPMDFDDYMAILRRRWLWIAIPALIAPLIAYAISLALPEQYVSQTLVLVEQQKVPEGYVKPVVNEDLTGRLASMREEILSRTRLQPIIESFGLYDKGKLPMEEKLEVMRKSIVITPIRPDVTTSRTNGVPGFFIAFTSDRAKTAQQVCGEITSMFLSENLKAREQSAAGTTAFLARQLDDAKRSLDEQDAKLADFQRKYVGQLPGQEQANFNMLNSLNTQLEATTQALSRLEQEKTFTGSLLAQEVAAFKTDQGTAKSARSPEDDAHDIDHIEEMLITLRNKYTDDHPDVIKTRRDLEALKAKRDSDKTKRQADAVVKPQVEPPTIQQMRAQMEATDLAMKSKRNDQQRIQAQISTYQRRLELSPTVQEEHKKLTRDYQSALQFYNELLAKKNQSEMATDLERRQQGEQFRVMDPPNLPERPAFPDRRLFAAGGLGVGFVIGLTLVAFFEWHDRSVRNERDVELWLKLPTLGVIPDFSDSDDADKKKTKDAKQKTDAKSKKDKARKVAPKPKVAAVSAPGSTATPASALSPGVETHV